MVHEGREGEGAERLRRGCGGDWGLQQWTWVLTTPKGSLLPLKEQNCKPLRLQWKLKGKFDKETGLKVTLELLVSRCLP